MRFQLFVLYLSLRLCSSTVQLPTHVTEAVAVLTGSNVTGTVTFAQTVPDTPMLVTINLSGLEAGNHGFHIHQFGNLSNGCISAGPHFNPQKNNHSSPDNLYRHAGDLGNVVADKSGKVIAHYNVSLIAMFGKNSIIGRTVVVHAAKDDLGLGGNEESLKTGNAGARLACGIIGISDEKAFDQPFPHKHENKNPPSN